MALHMMSEGHTCTSPHGWVVLGEHGNTMTPFPAEQLFLACGDEDEVEVQTYQMEGWAPCEWDPPLQLSKSLALASIAVRQA